VPITLIDLAKKHEHHRDHLLASSASHSVWIGLSRLRVDS